MPDPRLSALREMVAGKLADIALRKAAGERFEPARRRVAQPAPASPAPKA